MYWLKIFIHCQLNYLVVFELSALVGSEQTLLFIGGSIQIVQIKEMCSYRVLLARLELAVERMLDITTTRKWYTILIHMTSTCISRRFETERDFVFIRVYNSYVEALGIFTAAFAITIRSRGSVCQVVTDQLTKKSEPWIQTIQSEGCWKTIGDAPRLWQWVVLFCGEPGDKLVITYCVCRVQKSLVWWQPCAPPSLEQQRKIKRLLDLRLIDFLKLYHGYSRLLHVPSAVLYRSLP